MIKEVEKKSEIVAIFNKYKDTLDNLINSLNTDPLDHTNSPNWLGLIDEGSRNTSKFRDSSPTFLKKNCLDEHILIILLEPTPKIQDSKYINATRLQPLVPKVEEHNIIRVNGVGRMRKVKRVEKIERVREVEKAIKEIR